MPLITISNEFKYNLFHIPVIAELITSFVKAITYPYEEINIFIIVSTVIQILLCIMIGYDNNFINIPDFCYWLIGFNNIVSSVVLSLFVLLNIKKIKHIEDNIFLGSFIILTFIYQLDVIFIINSYYLSGKKFKEHKINCILPVIIITTTDKKITNVETNN